MFEEKYEALNGSEQVEFRRIINLILEKTFIVNRMYNSKKMGFLSNPDYRFIDRNIEMFREYLEYAGFKLQRDSNYEVIYLENEYSYNKAKLDKITTIFLYVLRLIFDEDREKVKLNSDTVVTVSDIIKTLMAIGVYNKKPTDSEIKSSLSKLMQFNIIQKIDGQLENPDTKVVILPSILFAITNEKITSLSNMITKLEDEAETEVEDNESINEDVTY